jgi:5-methylcytosine-specific restriction endonuclease McrA
MNFAELPKTRAEAMASGAKYYFTGEPCKHGHVAPRKTKGACLDCLKAEWEENNKKRAAYFAAYNKSDAGQAAKQRYYETNKERVKERANARPTEDKQRYRDKWAEENVVIVRAFTKARRRKHRSATPLWLTDAQFKDIRAIYEQAISLSRATGVPYVVDHIIPLQHEDICGLHVPWNLRVITRKENGLKSNKIPSEEFYLAWPKGA